MQPESRTTRSFFHKRLAELKSSSPGVTLAAIASEDGLLAATDSDAQPGAIDRRAAVIASLAAVAMTTARELGRGPVSSLRLGCDDGAILVRPFGRPRRRLLLLVLEAGADAQRVSQAGFALANELEQRLLPAPDTTPALD